MGKLRVLNGRLDAAIERLRGWRRHYAPDEASELIDVAEALQERGDPYTRDEIGLMGLADRLSLLTRSRPSEPRPASPVDERIEVAEGEEGAATVQYEAEIAKLDDARKDQQSAKANIGAAMAKGDAKGVARAEAELHAAIDRATRAEADVLIADHQWLRARSRLTALKAVRSRWHAERTSYVRGPNGQTMTLAEFGRL